VTVPSPLARYHQVLLAISKEPAGLNLQDLVRETQLPRSSSHRIATALCGIGYLEVTAGGNYVFGPAFRDLLRRSITADNRLEAFQPALQYLVSELQETAFFARLVNGTVNLAQALTPTSPERSYIYPGTGPRPLDTCSSSKAILAFAGEAIVKELFQSGTLPFDNSTSLTKLLHNLRQVGQDGYAICDGDIDEGVFSLACPVHLGSMLGLYSIGVVGPTSRMKAMEVQRIAETVRHAACIASENLIRKVSARD
jgi:DNA-binding IclR family transcriptional regulator